MSKKPIISNLDYIKKALCKEKRDAQTKSLIIAHPSYCLLVPELFAPLSPSGHLPILELFTPPFPSMPGLSTPQSLSSYLPMLGSLLLCLYQCLLYMCLNHPLCLYLVCLYLSPLLYLYLVCLCLYRLLCLRLYLECLYLGHPYLSCFCFFLYSYLHRLQRPFQENKNQVSKTK